MQTPPAPYPTTIILKFRQQNSYYRLPILDGLELLDASYHRVDFPFHSHATFNISLITGQTFANKLTDRILQATTGTIIITNPAEVHASVCDKNMGTSFFTFYVSPGVMQELNGGRPVWFETKVLHDEALYIALYNLSQNFTAAAYPVEQLLLKSLRRLIKGYANTEKAAPTSATRLFQSFLENGHPDPFSLDATARQFGLDKFKFLRLFKQQTGLTPNNFIILRRIEKAKHLLQTGDNLLDIALDAGFCDATHLCHHFKKITGVTPMTYRNAALCNIIQ